MISSLLVSLTKDIDGKRANFMRNVFKKAIFPLTSKQAVLLLLVIAFAFASIYFARLVENFFSVREYSPTTISELMAITKLYFPENSKLIDCSYKEGWSKLLIAKVALPTEDLKKFIEQKE